MRALTHPRAHTHASQTAKPGHHKESLPRLKAWNIVQALLTANMVLNAWQMYSGMLPPETYAVDALLGYAAAHDVALPLGGDGSPVMAATPRGDFAAAMKSATVFIDVVGLTSSR